MPRTLFRHHHTLDHMLVQIPPGCGTGRFVGVSGIPLARTPPAGAPPSPVDPPSVPASCPAANCTSTRCSPANGPVWRSNTNRPSTIAVFADGLADTARRDERDQPRPTLRPLDPAVDGTTTDVAVVAAGGQDHHYPCQQNQSSTADSRNFKPDLVDVADSHHGGSRTIVNGQGNMPQPGRHVKESGRPSRRSRSTPLAAFLPVLDLDFVP